MSEYDESGDAHANKQQPSHHAVRILLLEAAWLAGLLAAVVVLVERL